MTCFWYELLNFVYPASFVYRRSVIVSSNTFYIIFYESNMLRNALFRWQLFDIIMYYDMLLYVNDLFVKVKSLRVKRKDVFETSVANVSAALRIMSCSEGIYTHAIDVNSIYLDSEYLFLYYAVILRYFKNR